MKTSNKILLGLFLGALLILSAVHATLYSKYKSGDFTYITDNIWQPHLASFSLQDIKYVSVESLNNVTIRPSDTLRLQYEGPDKGKTMDFRREGDTLVVRGLPRSKNGSDYGTPISIYVNETVPVWVRNGNVTLKGAKDSASARSLTLNLEQTRIYVTDEYIPYLGDLTVNAQASNVNLDQLIARNVKLSLKNSQYEERTGMFGSFNVEADFPSRLSLGAPNFNKAKINQHD